MLPPLGFAVAVGAVEAVVAVVAVSSVFQLLFSAAVFLSLLESPVVPLAPLVLFVADHFLRLVGFQVPSVSLLCVVPPQILGVVSPPPP